VEPTPLSALRGRLAVVLVGGLVIGELDGLGDAVIGGAGGITAVCGPDSRLDERAATL